MWLAWLAIAETALADVPADVRELIEADRIGRALRLARGWLALDPTDPARWVLLAQLQPDARIAEALDREALRLDPARPDVLVHLALALAAQGAVDGADATLARAVALAPEDAAVLLAVARLHQDPEPIRRLAADPAHPEAALWLARLDPASADAVLAGVNGRAGTIARAERALAKGLPDMAAGELAGLNGRDVERLRRWTRCEHAGAIDGATWTALDAARQWALAHPGAPPDFDPLVARAGKCAAAHELRAAVVALGRPEEAARELGIAVMLAPDDLHLRSAWGQALVNAGHPREATPILEAAVVARPDDAEALLALGKARLGLRDRAGGQALLREAAARFPEHAGIAVALAESETDEAAALDDLLRLLAVVDDDGVEERARAMAAALGRSRDLAAAMDVGPRPSALPPLPEDVAEEIIVTAEKPSAQRLAELVAGLRELGYGEPRTLGDRTLRFAGSGVSHPWVELHPDGLVDLQQEGMVATSPELTVLSEQDVREGSIASLRGSFGHMTRKQFGPYRWEVLQAMKPELVAWREALCAEGFEERLLAEIPATLDAVWRDGASLVGEETLDTPAARRAALLDWWATRTCTPEGEDVREVIARYLRTEVQTSAWPVTREELTATNARRSCPGELVL